MRGRVRGSPRALCWSMLLAAKFPSRRGSVGSAALSKVAAPPLQMSRLACPEGCERAGGLACCRPSA